MTGPGPGQVFIAGTGRSGTSLMHDLLGSHPDAFKLPFESKFIVEGDGLAALVPRLCETYSVTASDLALERFIFTTDADLADGEEDPERDSWKYFTHLGREHYFPPLRAFVAAVRQPVPGDAVVARSFESREAVIGLARDLVAEMFGAPTLAAGKTLWIEKTPSNLVEMDFLWELFPQAAMVHIKRDPRAVLHSLMQQPWMPAPGDLAFCTAFLKGIYGRWLRLRDRLDFAGRRYVEVRLEDLCRTPQAVMEEVAGTAGLTNQFDLRRLRADRVEAWRAQMPPDHRRYAERELARFFAPMGYALETD